MAGKFKIKRSANQKFHFNLVAGNGQIILSSQMYETKAAAENGIESVRINCSDENRFERKVSTGGDPYFVLKAANGLEIGRSQMYKSADGMENGIKSVKNNAPSAGLAYTSSA